MMKKLSYKEKILLHRKKRKYQKLLLAACLGILLLAAVFFLIKKPRKATDTPQTRMPCSLLLKQNLTPPPSPGFRMPRSQ